MIDFTTWLATPVLAVAAWLVGRAMAERLAPHASPSPSTALATGLVAGHVVLQMLALLGWRWSALWLGGLLAAAAAALLGAWRSNFRRPILPRGRVTLGFGDAISAVAVAGVSWAAVTRHIDNPDFIYHWGVKGRKFALAAGIDWSYLSSASAWHLHPDYPNLLPEITSWTLRMERSMAAGPQLAWTAVFFAALLLAAREALAALEVSRGVRQWVLAAIAAAIAGFAFAAEMGGSADWLIAWAVVLAIPALVEPAAPGAELRLATAAALAAGAKIEGVPLAVAMLGAFALARRSAGVARGRWWSLLRTAAPVVAVVLPWVLLCVRHGLFQSTNHGDWSWQRLAVALPGLVRGLIDPLWGGLAVTVVLLPWLALRSATRWPAAVLLAQAAFYVAVYATAPVDTALYVQTSWARLLFHLLPAVWVLAAATVERSPARSLASAPALPDAG